ncbi:hypothetical protein VNO78_07516 [Psophocarpus tetragonolobus]|uniref:PHD-type domain-containing protein n=1 Tax=Psophocarpus tetragonolobus TaxID=3891 RepID=A0AAN9ST73_PSOTE
MESSVRSGGSGVVVKSRNSSGCLIVRKKGDGLGANANASSSRKLYEAKKRANFNVSVSMSDSGSSDELLMHPGRRLGPESIRVCNGLAAYERCGNEISRKRDGVERIRGSGEGIAVEKGLDWRERKRSKLDVYDLYEYDGMGVENTRGRHLDGNEVGHRGGIFVGSVHAARSGIGRGFKAGSSRHVVDKRKNSYGDGPSGLYPGDNVDHVRLKKNRDGIRIPLPVQREKFNSDETIRVQGKNGVLKVMVNKKKVGGSLEQRYDHHKPMESRLKTEETAKRLKTEDTAKRNVLIRSSLYLEMKPVEKSGLLKRPEKKQIASRKSSSSKDSKGDEGDSDNSDKSLNVGVRNTEAQKPVKKLICEDEQTPVHEKLPTTKTKEGKIKRGSGTEKQKLRERIREMLLNSGWTIDYRPRRNRDYLDAVYINPAGTAYWSIIKAYDALQKQLNHDANEVKPKGDSSSFAPIADEVLSQLTRKTRKKMEKELKNKKQYDSESDNEIDPQIRISASSKHDMNGMDDNNEEKLSSLIKQGSKSMKNKLFENTIVTVRSKIQNSSHHSSDRIEKSLFGRDPHIHGRTSKKHGRCTLLVRSSNKGSNSECDGFVPYTGKRTILAWLIDSGTVELSQKVQYRRRKKVMLEGWITRDGIHCGCCSKILTVSKFELHAGSKLPQPYQNIYLESGVSLLQCQIDAWNRQENSEKNGFHSVDIDGDDPNDDTCGICGDGGDLICCDGCPSTFHQSCLDIQMLPPGEWRCPNCSCKFCGMASGISEKDDAYVDVLLTCNLCEKKYHDSCTKEMDTRPNEINGSSLSFCGKECKELSEHLKKYLGTKHELEAGFSWSLIHKTDEDSEAACRGISQRVECNSKLAIALTVMEECFLPVIDRRSGINLIRNVLYNSGSNFSRLNYSGFYTAILERGDEIIAAASIRFHGTKITEMPFIGTRHVYRRQGMCRLLFSAIDSTLCSLKVENLVIPAIAELTHTWTTVFGFTHLDQSLRQKMKSLNMMVFPGIDMLQKLLVEQEKHEDSEKMGNGDDDCIKTKMENRSDMGSSTPQDPHGSDDVSSNLANDANDECSDASQEINNQVFIDGTLCSKSHSEELVSDSASDKYVSPSRTSRSVLEMNNKVLAAPPVDRLNSFKCQFICPNDTSVSSHPVDILKAQALVQETTSFDPCSAENLDKKCHSSTAMNCDSSELYINALLDSQMTDNTLRTKEAYMNNALEVVPSGTEENITKGNNQNVESSSALNHADESSFQVRSDSNSEFGCENQQDLHLNPGLASNETYFDESGVNASGDSSETVLASQFSRLLKLLPCALIWVLRISSIVLREMLFDPFPLMRLASNETYFDESGVNASGDSSETVLASQFSRLLKLLPCALIWVFSASLFKTMIMVSVLVRKGGASLYNQHFISRAFNFCFKSLTTIPNKDVEVASSSVSVPPSEYSTRLHLSPFSSDFNHPGFDIELVDHDAWEVSSGVAQAWREPARSFGQQVTHEAIDDHVDGQLDFEDIDNMRVHGNLFYKLERSSKEFEEYNLDFHKKKSSKKKEKVNKAKEEVNRAVTTSHVASKDHKADEFTRSKSVVSPFRVDESNNRFAANKRQRTPTFNQLTGPYHEPFCLDIFISKASVRACVVHRVTSKVVAVAHSISKDIKFDFSSTKNKNTCAAVGAILAQRALADDIHDIIYTPRKGERVEGKLQIVLQSIIDNGINVKVKIKQRPKKSFNRI